MLAQLWPGAHGGHGHAVSMLPTRIDYPFREMTVCTSRAARQGTHSPGLAPVELDSFYADDDMLMMKSSNDIYI